MEALTPKMKGEVAQVKEESQTVYGQVHDRSAEGYDRQRQKRLTVV